MTNGEYFFLIFLGTVALTRFFIFTFKRPGPTIKGFRVRHYMYGVVLILVAFLTNNLIIFALGFGLIIDELPVILIKGPGHKDEHWRGMGDYSTKWSVAGVLILIFVVYLFRSAIAGWI